MLWCDGEAREVRSYFGPKMTKWLFAVSGVIGGTELGTEFQVSPLSVEVRRRSPVSKLVTWAKYTPLR